MVQDLQEPKQLFFLISERGEETEKERNIYERSTNRLPLTQAPTREQLATGIELATFHFVGQCPNHWATRPKAKTILSKENQVKLYPPWMLMTKLQ